MKITNDMADRLLTEFEPHKFIAEASDLGLTPGQWPSHIATDMGNGLAFLRGEPKRNEADEITSVPYWQTAGCIDLEIIND